MNFNELYRKIADLDKPVGEECGMPSAMPSTPPANEPPPSMSVNLNAQGMDNISNLMKLISKVNPDVAGPKVDAMVAPLQINKPDAMNNAELDDIDTDDNKLDIDVDGDSQPDIALKKGEAYSNQPNEQYADIDDITVNAGGGMNGPKHPKDLRVKDPSPYENEAYENEPDEKYDDHLRIIKHLAGGMNKEKTMVKHSYKQGDNPMAMPESEDPLAAIKNDLRARLQEYKNQ
jgi:hypothetical protein